MCINVIIQQKGLKFLLTAESVQSPPPSSYHKKGMFPSLQGTIKLKAVSRLLGRMPCLQACSAQAESPVCRYISTFPIVAALTLQWGKILSPNLFNFWLEVLVVWSVVRCCGKELGPLCWPVQLQVLQFLVHLINFLSICLRCNDFAGTQKAVVDQTGSRPPNGDHDLFFGASLALGSALESFLLVQLLSWLSAVVV